MRQFFGQQASDLCRRPIAGFASQQDHVEAPILRAAAASTRAMVSESGLALPSLRIRVAESAFMEIAL